MFNLSKKLEKIYLLFFIINLLAIIGISHIIRGDFSISENLVIREEYLESFFIILMFLAAYFIFKSYQKEIEKNKEHLEEAFKYIGQVNVQLQEIEDALSKIDKVPENKKELKNLMNYLAKKALSIINADWVLIRIIEVETLNTLRESIKSRGGAVLLKHEIANKNLLEENKLENYIYITSKQKNLGIKSYFIFPDRKITKKEEILIKALVNQLEMIFVIFSSKYFN